MLLGNEKLFNSDTRENLILESMEIDIFKRIKKADYKDFNKFDCKINFRTYLNFWQ